MLLLPRRSKSLFYFGLALLPFVAVAAVVGARRAPDAQLFAAVQQWENAAAIEALQAGANPNAVVSESSSGFPPQPLLVYAIERRPSLAPLLIEKGADVNTLKDGSIPVMKLAIEKNDAALVAALLDKGADPNMAAKAGPGSFSRKERSILMVALEADNPKIVKLLVQKGANVNHRASDGYKEFTPLMIAARTDASLVQLLLEAGTDPFAKDLQGHTALDIARQLKQKKSQDILLKWMQRKSIDNKEHSRKR